MIITVHCITSILTQNEPLLSFTDTTIQFANNEKHEVMGSYCTVYLLEKSRVVVQSKEERNYHFFYQILTQSKDTLNHLGLINDPNYYRYLKALKKNIGYGVSLNTSFNLHGRTIVRTPKDAIIDFIDCNLDELFIEGYRVRKMS